MSDIDQSQGATALTKTALTRIALAIEYDGSRFSGWQKQLSPTLPTVQAAVEAALSKIANHPVSLVCAGRTDKGVHATAQVVHFDCQIDRGIKAWVQGVNSLLPATVRVRWAMPVRDDFHARFSATARRYLYVIYQDPIAPAIMAGKLTHVRNKLDLVAMQQAAQHLVGEHDFSSYRAAGCQSKTPFRQVYWAKLSLKGPFLVLDIKANAFLQHMVRNISGMLIEVGCGRKSPLWAKQLLELKDRTRGGVTASGDGLYLAEVSYPGAFGLPESALGPVFLQSLLEL